jgi:hypothetical protein
MFYSIGYRTHSPVVRRHEAFTEIVSKLHRLQLEQLPFTVQWILCDANISPEEAIPHLKRLCAAYYRREETYQTEDQQKTYNFYFN